MKRTRILKKYYGEIEPFLSASVLSVIDDDIKHYCDDYDDELTYAGRGDSSSFSLSEFLIPEFDYNDIFYIHDQMYKLAELNIVGYSKELADNLMYELLLYEDFEFAYLYYYAVVGFG